jgi:hypothetical protein
VSRAEGSPSNPSAFIGSLCCVKDQSDRAQNQLMLAPDVRRVNVKNTRCAGRDLAPKVSTRLSKHRSCPLPPAPVPPPVYPTSQTQNYAEWRPSPTFLRVSLVSTLQITFSRLTLKTAVLPPGWAGRSTGQVDSQQESRPAAQAPRLSQRSSRQ